MRLDNFLKGLSLKIPPKEDLFLKLNFRESQLAAIRELYYKYFEPITENFQYLGYGITMNWYRGNTNESVEHYSDSFKNNEIINGWAFPKSVSYDPLWQEFEDILPYMSRDATITIMPPMTVMSPHVDRPNRGHAIYFPISGNGPNCFSECYALPKSTNPNIRNSTKEAVVPIYTYNTINNAYMMNVDEWHGVRNMSRQTRIAFGWNTTGAEGKKSFAELRKIFTDLGYIK